MKRRLLNALALLVVGAAAYGLMRAALRRRDVGDPIVWAVG